MGSTVFRNPRALSSALAVLGTLQPRALGFLNTVDPLDTVSNCYIDLKMHIMCFIKDAELHYHYRMHKRYNDIIVHLILAIQYASYNKGRKATGVVPLICPCKSQ